MARPREFDRDHVLDKAIDVFWSKGYDRTSIQDLVDQMGIQRGSLYAAFGDKQRLFLEALERYEERFHRSMVEHLSQDRPAKESIRAVFQEVLNDCACADGSKGCFVTNTAVALAAEDELVARSIRDNLRRVEDAFAAALTEAARSGQLSTEHDPRALARFLTNGLQGLRVLARCCVDVAVLRDAVDLTLSLLDNSINDERFRKETDNHGRR